MSGEATLWAYVRKGMRGRWHCQRHEDKLCRGIPDVSYAIEGVDGWIELKSLADWPKLDRTPVNVGISPEQVAWLETRGDMGNGRCFVLIRVRQEHLLVRWTDARSLLRGILRDELRARADAHYQKGIDWDDLVWQLRQGDR